ncbi:MAG TPA: sialate O-acetylesterase [Luteolibacter sp.]|nr:sialate O-acetylesterase [Luteolibacter sp.]
MHLRLLSLACLIILGSGAVARAEEAAAQGRHLFILSGQSNMTGNLEQGFREKVVAKYGAEKVTIVRSMRSGRGIRFWVSDYGLPEGTAPAAREGGAPSSNGEEYPRLIEAAKAAGDAKAFASVTFVWMQGESDANRAMAERYGESFRRLRQRLMNDLGIASMNVVIGRISDYGLKGENAEGWRAMREVQERLAKDLPHAVWVNTDDLNDIEGKPEGDLHYPKEGSVIVGQRLAEEAVELLERKN